jgi:hypothetical protein
MCIKRIVKMNSKLMWDAKGCLEEASFTASPRRPPLACVAVYRGASSLFRFAVGCLPLTVTTAASASTPSVAASRRRPACRASVGCETSPVVCPT